jgi:hypothetical protein
MFITVDVCFFRVFSEVKYFLSDDWVTPALDTKISTTSTSTFSKSDFFIKLSFRMWTFILEDSISKVGNKGSADCSAYPPDGLILSRFYT